MVAPGEVLPYLYASEPDKWLGFQQRRDEFRDSDDRFMWTIETFLDERSSTPRG